jgi:two-component system osmolarity sensor histidine kinase EnvZ
MLHEVQDFIRRTPGLNLVSRAMRRLGAILKPLTPRSLNGRFVLIIVTPVILIQIASTWLYMERYSQQVTRRLSASVGGEIAFLIEATQPKDYKTGNAKGSMGQSEDLFRLAEIHNNLTVRIEPDAVLPTRQPEVFFSFISSIMRQQLEATVRRPIWFDLEKRPSIVEIQVQLEDAVMFIELRRSRIIATNWHNFLVWMVIATALFLGIAILFLRNQVRAILRLALAAENFGKGRDVPDFKPAGAREVRSAARAVIEMRDRVNAHVMQRTEMLAGVSHDLRTPITRMKLQLAMLGDTPDIQDMKSDLEEMEYMLQEYLDFARGEAGEETVPGDVAEVLGEIKASAARRGHDVRVEAENLPKIPLRRTGFKRCITNLVNNACAFGTEVSVTAEHHSTGITITVEDNGPGIPAHRREEAFRPFHRLDEGRNLDQGGSGLGLAIARDIARAHGGDIELGDAGAGGLKATVRLPG